CRPTAVVVGYRVAATPRDSLQTYFLLLPFAPVALGLPGTALSPSVTRAHGRRCAPRGTWRVRFTGGRGGRHAQEPTLSDCINNQEGGGRGSGWLPEDELRGSECEARSVIERIRADRDLLTGRSRYACQQSRDRPKPEVNNEHFNSSV